MSEAGLRLTLELSAPLERAFAAITEARHLRRWLCDACESEPRANGRLIMRWRRRASAVSGHASGPVAESGALRFEGRWVEFSPPARAAFQGGNSSYPKGDAGTVWFSLAPAGDPAAPVDRTRFEVRHEWPQGEGYDAAAESWRSAWPRALERLRKLLEREAGLET